jgi:PIN like domain
VTVATIQPLAFARLDLSPPVRARWRRRRNNSPVGISKQSSATSDLYQGFEAYRDTTEIDYQRVLNEGLVVPDANVLLNLYRYTGEARSDLLAVLRRLGDRLWVPHHALTEFWRNRESAILDPKKSAESAEGALTSQLREAQEAVRRWGKRVAAPPQRVDELAKSLGDAFLSVMTEVTGAIDSDELETRRQTNSDDVLAELEAILQGRVGRPLDSESHASALKEAQRRIEANEPPGFADKSKGSAGASGDYLIWEQTLREAESRRVHDVLIVTGDVKDDWWRRVEGQTRGPRLELAREMADRAEANLYMIRPESLLRLASAYLQVEVREASFQDVERVASLLDAGDGDGWTAEALLEALARLDVEAPVQAEVVRAALQHEGFVPREDVYRIGQYSDDRTLRGFTRRTRRISQELRDAGVLPETAADLLQTVYDPAFSAVEASGFRIPSELQELASFVGEPAPPWGWIIRRAATAYVAGAQTGTVLFRDLDGVRRTILAPAAILTGANLDPASSGEAESG